MDRTELERLLRKWGHVFGEKAPSEWDEDRSGYTHPIARVSEHAPGGEDKRIATHRAGQARRRFMGEKAGLQSIRGGKVVTVSAPAWAVETVSGNETRSGHKPWHPDHEAEMIDLAWLSLHRFDRRQAVVLKIEYCTRGKQKEKAERSGRILNEQLKLRRYRLELDYARAWMLGRLTKPVAA